MFDRTYQPGGSFAPVSVADPACSHPAHEYTPEPATHERGGFPLCFGHFLVALQWEQRRVDVPVDEDAP